MDPSTWTVQTHESGYFYTCHDRMRPLNPQSSLPCPAETPQEPRTVWLVSKGSWVRFQRISADAVRFQAPRDRLATLHNSAMLGLSHPETLLEE